VASRARDLAAKVPTKWILAGSAALVLAASALFGGLNDAPADPIPTLRPGDSSTGTRVELAVDRVVVIDGFPDLYLEPEPGFRYLVVIGTATNVWSSPVPQSLSSFGTPQPATVVSPRIEGLEAVAPEEVLVFSDATTAGDLQPGVPVQLAYLWQFPAEAIADGDEVTLDLWDETYEGDSLIGFGDRFSDPFVTATLTLPATDSSVVDNG